MNVSGSCVGTFRDSTATITCLISDFLGKLMERQLWKPTYTLLSTVVSNFGLIGRELAKEDRDIETIDAVITEIKCAKFPLGRSPYFLQEPVKFLLRLIDACATAHLFEQYELELVSQLVVMLCTHNAWEDSILKQLGVKCLSKLMEAVTDDGRSRMRIFCSMD